MNTQSKTAAPALPKASKAETLDERNARLSGGFDRQLEPKPEDYPASARMTPPAEQLNPSLSQAVGNALPPAQGGADDSLREAITDGAEQAQDITTRGHELATHIASKRAELNDLEAEAARQ